MGDFLSYSLNILRDKNLASSPFYKTQSHVYTYESLLLSARKIAYSLNLLPDSFLALQMESSYKLFIHLLAGLMTNKEFLIISAREPELSVVEYKKTIGFSKVIKDETLTENEMIDIPKIDVEKIAFAILSSGSSGPSKAIKLTLNNVWSSSASVAHFFQMKSAHTSFLNLPHHHIGGLMILWRAFFSGGPVTVNPEDHYDFISLVPLQLQRILAAGDKPLEKLQQTKAILIGGAALSTSLKEEAQKKGLALFETYGMSETSSLVMLNGKPLSGQEIKLDEAGHFLIKGPTLSPFVKKDHDGFYHTKDLGVKNPDGTFSFLKRSDLMFKSAGEMINPLEIEHALKTLPWIREAIIVPIDHPEWTKASTLLYQTSDPEKNAADIKSFLREHFHPYQIPRYFYEAPDTLFIPGMKPKRYELINWAQDKFYREIFNLNYISHNAESLMVIFHGFMEDAEDMLPLAEGPHKNDYLLIDLPGHGKTKISSFKNREEVFSLLEKMISFYQKNRTLLFYGYSMGGRIAIELTLTMKVDTLILESASFGLENSEEKLKRKSSDEKLFSYVSDLKSFFKSWYENPIFSTYNLSENYAQEIERKLKRDNSQHEWQRSLEFFSPGAASYLLHETLKKLENQKIIGIVGLEDKKYKEHFQAAQKSLKGLTLHIIPNVGHNPHKTHLKEIKAILNDVI